MRPYLIEWLDPAFADMQSGRAPVRRWVDLDAVLSIHEPTKATFDAPPRWLAQAIVLELELALRDAPLVIELPFYLPSGYTMYDPPEPECDGRLFGLRVTRPVYEALLDAWKGST